NRNRDHGAARLLQPLADRLRNLIRLAERDSDVTLPITHGDQGREREATAALHDLRHAVHEDHVLHHVRLALARTATLTVASAALSAGLVSAASRLSRHAALILHRIRLRTRDRPRGRPRRTRRRARGTGNRHDRTPPG